ncbi:MAG: dienelactone hydrolase family protein [Hamadaea sp.]|nr:dienelactone hydrolase family protein [Hamadaea sp.]
MGEKVTFPSNGGTSEGYLAVPASGSGPAILVIQEWWGLVSHITGLADRFAEAGFVALAPDFYHGEATTEPDEARSLLMQLALPQAAADIAGAAAYLKGLPQVAGGVGVVGFCAGGSLALWSATVSPDIAAVCAFYPGGYTEKLAPQWSAYDGTPVVIHCAEGDGTSAAPHIQTAVKGIEDAGGTVTVYDYAGTDHAFFNDDRPEHFHRDAATLAWARTLDFFRTSLA